MRQRIIKLGPLFFCYIPTFPLYSSINFAIHLSQCVSKIRHHHCVQRSYHLQDSPQTIGVWMDTRLLMRRLSCFDWLKKDFKKIMFGESMLSWEIQFSSISLTRLWPWDWLAWPAWLSGNTNFSALVIARFSPGRFHGLSSPRLGFILPWDAEVVSVNVLIFQMSVTNFWAGSSTAQILIDCLSWNTSSQDGQQCQGYQCLSELRENNLQNFLSGSVRRHDW